MYLRIAFILFVLEIIAIQSIFSQQLNLSDSTKSRTESVSNEEIRLYPFNSASSLLRYKSSLYMFGNNLVNSGLFLTDESFSIDGMNVRGIEYLPDVWSSGIRFQKDFSSLKSAYSPEGKYDFMTSAHSDENFFDAEFRGSMHKLQSSIVMSDKIERHKGDTKPIEIFLSGYAESALDGGPFFVDNVTMNQLTEDALSSSPLANEELWYSPQYGTEITGIEGLETQTYIRNTKQKKMSLYGKAKIPLTNSMEINMQSLFSHAKGNVDVFSNRLFNYMNNPEFSKNYFDGKVTFDHTAIEMDDFRLKYQIGIGYDKGWANQGSDKYDKDFFRYCYIGSYTENKEKAYDSFFNEGQYWSVMNGFSTTGLDFIPGSLNPGLVSYVQAIEASGTADPYTFFNYQNGYLPGNTSAGWSNFNVPVSIYSEQQSSRINISGSADAEFEKSKVSFGFDYRNDTYRKYSINTAGLYTQMRNELNSHIAQLDLDNPMEETIEGVTYITYNRLYDADAQTEFDRNLRTRLGLPITGTDFILIDSYDYDNNTIKYYDGNSQLKTLQVEGELLNLNLLGPTELLNISNISGYDVYGNKVRHAQDPYSTPEDGAQIPYSPTNLAVWLNYKHEKGRLKVEGGIRVERFDARQPVLADPLSLFPIYTVAESPQLNHSVSAHPGWLVYLDPNDNSKVQGYREGDQWFTPTGKLWNLSSFDIVDPFFKDAGDWSLKYMKFIDYKPVISILPSADIILDLGSTFYTRLTYNSYSRNPSLNVYNANSYSQLPLGGTNTLQNQGLKPERFDKTLLDFGYFGGKGLSASVTAGMMWYSNAIQQVYVANAFPRNYYSYQNSNNIIRIPTAELKINYSRYWWEGGVNYAHTFLEKEMSLDDIKAKSSLALYLATSRDIVSCYGALKFHQKLEGFSVAGTWRYRGGTPYIVKIENFIANATQRIKASNELDLKMKYTFYLNRQEFRMDFFIQVLNVLNTETINYVYGNTGQPDDNGYLSNPEYQSIIASSADPQAFREQYALLINRPEFYSQPRTIWIGMNISF